jgi:hypothetical protein
VQPAESAYRGKVRCPWIPSASGGDHPIFESLHRGIATNRPSYAFVRKMKPGGPIPFPPAPVTRLLDFPRDVMREDGEIPRALGYIVGSPKEAPPRGRMLFIAGQGMFMNGMMLQLDEKTGEFDNDNFDFAVNAVRWLREAPDGKKRSRALLMVDGAIITNFNMDLSPRASSKPPQIPIPPVKAVNRLIRGMEEERLFHRILNGLLGDYLDRVIAILIALGTFVLLLYGAKKFLEARYARETAVPIMVGEATPLPATPPRSRQRRLALHRQKDASSPARMLVHAWLRAEFGVEPGQWSVATRVELQANGFLLTRWTLQRQTDLVVTLARSAAGPLTRHDFAALVMALPELSRAVQEGRLTLQVDGKPVPAKTE